VFFFLAKKKPLLEWLSLYKFGGPSPTKSQLLFSPPQLINIIEFSSLPSYLNQIVLHQKYITEGLSTTKIARELGISRTTVTVYLKKYDIPVRPVGKVKSKRTLAYGEKIINGKVEVHKQERRTVDSILKMKKEGLSYNAIARILNEMKVKTKSQGKKWHMETVRQIILREQV
jgi:DNA-binding CsgD family transcriptional regulator